MPPIETGAGLLALIALAAYLLGSVPFGVLVTRAMGLGDVRSIGSGNIGATNVLRTGSKKAAAATLLLDGGKGAVAVLAARAVAGEDAVQLAGLAAFLGHLFPVWLGFKGGKGVATFLGTLLALAFPVGLAACAIWLLTAVVSRISSLSALVAALGAPVVAAFVGHGSAVAMILTMAALIFVKHAPNIRRLMAGTEPRIGRKKEGAA
ncbi:glycerol-3-phosphate 1-O-acyltransferase PlsY [Alphaproteobacteria bacterium GH1-50]|uniref:Glycerol-3-phosphate acyltransferase n=1 Tax=Kangsaoukella pontilimi TaxID=2691042 RepID=A0A7C9IS09_9RHOB|nr:glycerol-3-phosphate 1-O-acyltransferase PlsY [Kangsaoukella pontilimi]MXQ09303.1 glycerol-3-phosphate 1-O-acyltransferase PlsY [Kangsaoukella pontilimi]